MALDERLHSSIVRAGKRKASASSLNARLPVLYSEFFTGLSAIVKCKGL